LTAREFRDLRRLPYNKNPPFGTQGRSLRRCKRFGFHHAATDINSFPAGTEATLVGSENGERDLFAPVSVFDRR
jgi:hypothetical protein